MTRTHAVALGLGLALAFGCSSDPEQERLEDGVDGVVDQLASRRLRDLARQADPSMSADAVIGTFFGGAYAAGARRPPEGLGYCPGRPTRTNCIVVRRGEGPREILVEGYGADLAAPRVVERVEVEP